MDDNDYARRLSLASHLSAPAIRQAIGGLAFAPGSAGLDAGCGAGQHTRWLAEAVGPTGSVAGLDIFAPNLDAARGLVTGPSSASRPRFVQGDLLRLPFRRQYFDWAWCADTLWPVVVAPDPVAGVRELARVVRPGGTVALLYWSGQSLLPGHPELEARLNAAFATTVPYLAGLPARLHFLRALGWLKAAGLADATAHTYLAEVQAPLSPAFRESLAFCLSMLWGNLEPYVAPADWKAYLRLSDPDSGHFILDNPDYYGFVTYTLFRGEVSSC